MTDVKVLIVEHLINMNIQISEKINGLSNNDDDKKFDLYRSNFIVLVSALRDIAMSEKSLKQCYDTIIKQ